MISLISTRAHAKLCIITELVGSVSRDGIWTCHMHSTNFTSNVLVAVLPSAIALRLEINNKDTVHIASHKLFVHTSASAQTHSTSTSQLHMHRCILGDLNFIRASHKQCLYTYAYMYIFISAPVGKSDTCNDYIHIVYIYSPSICTSLRYIHSN